jgi:hypothetical protein
MCLSLQRKFNDLKMDTQSSTFYQSIVLEPIELRLKSKNSHLM